MSFEELFRKTDLEKVKQNVALGNFYLIAAGKIGDYNLMCGSTPGFNVFLHKNCFSLFIAENRYTLEYIKKHKSYTVGFFDTSDLGAIKAMGFASGRESNKVKEFAFEMLSTPNGSVACKNAKLVLDLKLVALTQLAAENIVDEQDAAKFAEKKGFYAYNNLAIGEIVSAYEKI